MSSRTDLPHVTSLLKNAGLIDSQWFEQFDLDRGSALHEAARFLDEGDLDWESVDPIVLPRLRQYQKFLDDTKPEILAIEEVVVNEAMGYQGRLDRRVILGQGPQRREGILDLKGPAQAPWQSLQLALYAACFQKALARWTLHLSDDRYQLIEHKNYNDWTVAKAILTIAAWRKANGF